MPLNITSLKLFVAVIQEGTISKAAKKEFIAAAAVSQRMSDLEKMLGVKLLNRTNKGVTATQAGVELLYHAKSLLGDIKEIEAHMKNYSKGESGFISISANITSLSSVLPKILSLFQKSHQSINFRIYEKRSMTIINDVDNKKVDFGIYTDIPHSVDIDCYTILEDELILLVPEDHVLANSESIYFEESLEFEHICLIKGTHINYQIKKSALDVNRDLIIKAEVGSYETMCNLVNCGLGIAILPQQNILNHNLRFSKIVKLNDNWSKRKIMMAVKDVEKLSPNSKRFFDFILDYASKNRGRQ